jgi:hypothetical protein
LKKAAIWSVDFHERAWRRFSAKGENSMLFRTLCYSVTVIALAATGSLATDYSPPQSGHPSVESGVYQHHHNGIRLPKELKMMWRQEERPHLKSLPKEQRRGWLKTKWVAMTEQQKEAKISELQAKWNALPANVRDNLLEKKRQKREAKMMQRSGQNNQPMQPRQPR